MAGKKDIGIFELSELFGITPQAIRKYEAKGIIVPNRDTDNRYRKYSTWELVKLAVSRSLSTEGFSLNQVAEILETEDPLDHVKKLEVLQEQIAKEIVYRKRLLSRLDNQKKEYYGREGRKGQLQIEQIPALYCCKLTENGESVDKTGEELERLKAWIGALPLVGICFVHVGKYEKCTCLVISEADRIQFGLEHLVPDFIISEKMCVVCDMVIERSDAYYSVGDTLEEANQKVQTLGFQVEDITLLWLCAFTQREGIYRSYVKGLFPIVT